MASKYFMSHFEQPSPIGRDVHILCIVQYCHSLSQSHNTGHSNVAPQPELMAQLHSMRACFFCWAVEGLYDELGVSYMK